MHSNHKTSIEKLKEIEKGLFEIFENYPEKSDFLKKQLKEIEKINFDAGVMLGARIAHMIYDKENED